MTTAIQACPIEIITLIQQQSESTVSKINNRQSSFHLVRQYRPSHTSSFDYRIGFSFYFNAFDQSYLGPCHILGGATEPLSYLLGGAERPLKTWLKDALFGDVFDPLAKLQTTLPIWMQCFKPPTHPMTWFWLFRPPFHVYVLSSPTSCDLVFCPYEGSRSHRLICNQRLRYRLRLLHDGRGGEREEGSLGRPGWA